MPKVAAGERARCLVPAAGVFAPAEPKIDRHQHESRPMSNRHGEGPKTQLGWWYPCQRARMTRIQEPKETESHHQEAGANPRLSLPFDKSRQEREGKQHYQHRQQVTRGKRPKRRHKSARLLFHQAG